MQDSTSPTGGSDPEVLREISHELGNRFHRLFYGLAGLRDLGAAVPAEALDEVEGQAEALREAVEAGFACLAPVAAKQRELAVADVIESLRQGLGLREFLRNPDEGAVADGVLADPGLLSRSITTLASILGDQQPGAVTVVARDDDRRVALVLDLQAEGLLTGIRGCLLARWLQAQGGALEVEVDSVALVLPAAIGGDC